MTTKIRNNRLGNPTIVAASVAVALLGGTQNALAQPQNKGEGIIPSGSKNQLSEEIPTEIGNLSNLTSLNLRDNQLTGIIPNEICNQGDTSPELGNNQFCLPYPTCIGQNIGQQDLNNCSYELWGESYLVGNTQTLVLSGNELSGPIPPNPAELLMNDRLEFLIEESKVKYDYIIVDTAPAMIVTDTLLISQLADYTLYVTRADYTEKALLDFPKDLKKQSKLNGLAVILNDIDYSKFSYGAQYGYSYGYGYGYGEENVSRWGRIKKRISNSS